MKKRYAHIDAMTSSELSAFACADDTPPDECEYALRRLRMLRSQ